MAGMSDLASGRGDCFVAGTRIMTVDGQFSVERLEAGNWLPLVHNGRTSPVWWMGHRIIDCARHPHPETVWPIRIVRHAFTKNRPVRDLFLSPEHAIYVAGVLIPVRCLLNGGTVAQVQVNEVIYWHIELPGHGVVLAENLPCETYLDAGNRSAFSNGSKLAMLHPDFTPRETDEAPCAPIVTDGPICELTRERLTKQALALGWKTEPDNDGTMRWVSPDGPWFRLPA